MQILPIWSKSCSATGARDNGRCVLGTRNPANTEQDSTRLTSQYTLWCSLLIIAFSAHCWWQSAAAVTIWYMLNAFIAQAAPSAEAYLLPQPCLESHTHTKSELAHLRMWKNEIFLALNYLIENPARVKLRNKVL